MLVNAVFILMAKSRQTRVFFSTFMAHGGLSAVTDKAASILTVLVTSGFVPGYWILREGREGREGGEGRGGRGGREDELNRYTIDVIYIYIYIYYR